MLDKRYEIAHNVLMKRQLNGKEMREWTESVGGIETAADLIKERLKCSRSKAEKLASCRYPSVPPPLEQEALAQLMARPHEAVFPKAKRAS